MPITPPAAPPIRVGVVGANLTRGCGTAAAHLVSHPGVDVVAITVKVTEHDRPIRIALEAGKRQDVG